MIKKITITIVVAMLCLNFSLSAEEVVPLKIGDKVPERFWIEKLQVRNGSVTSEQTLAAYKGKAIILDFWGVSCSACIKAFPNLNVLHKKFANNLCILGVSQDNKKRIDQFFTKWENLLFPTVIGDSYLNSLFKHVFIPHEVWIDANGIVTGFTSEDKINKESISSFISGVKPESEMKIDQDLTKPLFASEILPYDRLQSYAVLLKGRIEGTGSANREIKMPGIYGITWTNQSLISLLDRIARRQLPSYSGKLILLSKSDSLELFPGKLDDEAKKDWYKSHNYTLSISMRTKDTTLMSDRMLQLLNDHSGYSIKVEMKRTKCLVLTNAGGERSKKQATGKMVNTLAQPIGKKLRNASLWYLTGYLNDENNGLPVIVDETGWKKGIDLDLKSEHLKDLQKQMLDIGFKLKPALRVLKVMVIKKLATE